MMTYNNKGQHGERQSHITHSLLHVTTIIVICLLIISMNPILTTPKQVGKKFFGIFFKIFSHL